MSGSKSLRLRAVFSEMAPVIPQDHLFRFLNFLSANHQLIDALRYYNADLGGSSTMKPITAAFFLLALTMMMLLPVAHQVNATSVHGAASMQYPVPPPPPGGGGH
jgi:hypothetical protein